jgi:hypothetical protein
MTTWLWRAAGGAFGRTLAGGLLLASATFAGFASQGTNDASAGLIWCSGDPTILVNGNPVSVTLSVPLDRLSSVDEVVVTFHVPSNAKVYAILNTSLLIPERTVIVKDQPAVYGLINKVRIPVEVTTRARGTAFPVGLTVISTSGTRLWIQGRSDQTLSATTYSFLNLRLF